MIFIRPTEMLCYSAPTAHDVELASSRKKSFRTKSGDQKFIFEEDSGKVIISQPDGRALHQESPNKPRNYIGLAVVVLVCFNPPFGIIAILFSVKSNKDFLNGRFVTSRRKGKASCVFSVIGIVSTLTTIFTVIFWPAFANAKDGT